MIQKVHLKGLGSYETFRVPYQICRTLCCIYLSISIPFRLAFVPDYAIELQYLGFVLSDFLCTMLFAIEIIINSTPFRGSCVVPSEEILVSRNQINTHYPHILRSKLKCFAFHFSAGTTASIIMTLPFEYISLFTDTKYTNFLLLNRALRVTFLPIYLSDIAGILEQKKFIRNIGLQRTWKLFLTMALAGHWCGCIFFLISKYEAMKGGTSTWPQEIGIYDVKSNTLARDGSPIFEIEMNQSEFFAYIQTLYWAYITMITTGFGDVVPISISETIWCIFSMYIGVVITTCTIANLQLLVTNMDAALTAFQYKLELLQRYMAYRDLPNHLQKRIISFYDYQWDLLKGADEEKFLGEMPRSLQQQVANYLYKDLIRSLPVLRKANNALLNALTECSEMNIYSPNDEILRPGEKLRGVLLISRGEVEILKGKLVERKMQRFDRYAEESLFQDKINEKLVRSKTFSEIFLLPAYDFQIIIKSQCDVPHILQMKETALSQTKKKGSSKAYKMFGSAQDTTPIDGFNKYCHPSSTFRKIWDCIMIFGLLFYACALPLSFMRFMKMKSFSEEIPFFIFSYFVDILFLIDLVLKFRYFMFTEEGIIQHNRERIKDHFFSEHIMWREIFASIPFDIIALISYRFSYLHLVRMTKNLRLLTISSYVNRAERLLEEFKLGLNQSHRRVIKLNLLMIIVCHWVGCIWYLCADISKLIGLDNNWIERDENNESLSIDHSDLGGFAGYLRSIYWAIVGMSTVGYGDIIPTNILETTVATIVILFGGLLLPAVVGGLAAYMGNLNMAKKLYKTKNSKNKSSMRRSQLKKTVMDKVIRYYNYLWSCHGGVDEQNIMDELNGPLWDKVAMHVNGEDIKNIPFFSSCDDRTKNHLVALLRPQVFLPGDIICNQGEVGKEMYSIERGKVVVSSKDKEMHYCVLQRGDYFGETSLLGTTLRIANVVAISYCDCFVLTKDDFNEVMMGNPPIKRQIILASIKKIVRKNHETNENISKNFSLHNKCTRVTEGKLVLQCIHKDALRTSKFHPECMFRQIWNIVILIATTYNAFAIPFRLSFSTSSEFYYIDWCLDLIFISDMYLNYSEFSYIEQGELVCDREKVKRHYLRVSFWRDFLATIPLDIFVVFFKKEKKTRQLLMAIVRIPKLIRLGKLLELLEDVFRMLKDTNIYIAPLELFELLSGVILVAHWAACGFYALARWKNNAEHCEGIHNHDRIIDWGNGSAECIWVDTWIQKQIIDGKIPYHGGDLWQLYLRSFNWALPTLVVVVIGDVVPITTRETIYVFVWMVVGVTINATIIGNVANLVANLETDSSEFLKKADDIKHFMHMNGVNQSLQNRIDDFLNYLWSTHRGMSNETMFINELPVTLQTEITDETRMHLIKECIYFDFCSDEIVKALTLCLKPTIFSVGDFLIYAGEMGQEMFFLDRGLVEVISSDCKTLYATLTEGSFFGETSLFFKQKRSSSVRALSFCEVFQLDKSDLDNELRQRDFDLSRMFEIFQSVALNNQRRNDAVTANLKDALNKKKKLSRIISIRDELSEPERQIKKIFLPHSVFRTLWDIMSAIFTIYYIIIIPYRIAFILDEEIYNILPWLSIDFFIDVFFIMDIILKYKYFSHFENGKIVKERERIKKHYFRNGMILDVASCLPIESFSLLVGLRYIFLLRSLHFVRVHRLSFYFSQIDHYLNLWKLQISSATTLLLRMFFFYILANHWCGCVWFIIHRYIEYNEEFTWATTDCPGDKFDGDSCLSQWNESLQQHDICSNNDIHKCYIRSIYFVITTISTVGYGDISPVTEIETLWEDVVVIIGACFFAGIIGAFTAYLSQNDTSGSNAFRIKLQKLQEYMNYRCLPQQLQNEILIYHKYKWNQTHIIDVQQVLSILSNPLQMDLSFEVSKHVISCVPVLNSFDRIVQKRIASAFMLQVSPAHSNIYHVGDIGWDIYFIGSGLIKITLPSDLFELDADGRVHAYRAKIKAQATGLLYKRGNHFGESCLLSESGVRQETCTAKTMAELYLISKDDLESIWSYVVEEEREKMRNDLLIKNGNVMFFFDDIEEYDDQNQYHQDKRDSDIFSNESYESQTSPPIHTNRHSLHEKSILAGSRASRFNSIRSPSTRKKRRARVQNKDWVRLRSFSAPASREAMAKMAQGARQDLKNRSRSKGWNQNDSNGQNMFRGLSEALILEDLIDEHDIGSDEDSQRDVS